MHLPGGREVCARLGRVAAPAGCETCDIETNARVEGNDGTARGEATSRRTHAPGALDEQRSRRPPPNHMLLPLVRLHFEREPAAQNALRQPIQSA